MYKRQLYDSYAASAIPVLRVSAATGEGLPELRRAMKGKLNALTGNSGVGKSSILNAMEPVFGLPVGEVSKALGRGRHTTRHVEMFPLDEDTYVIDTPGFSSFDTEELDLEPVSYTHLGKGPHGGAGVLSRPGAGGAGASGAPPPVRPPAV